MTKPFLLIFTFSFCFIIACNNQDSPRPASRVLGVSRTEPRPAAMTEAQRFGLDAAPTPAETRPQAQFNFDLPEGWSFGPQRPMRDLTVLITGAPEIECYVMTLNGDGGGIEANINRWREQMGLPPMLKGDLDKLGKIQILGASGVLVEMSGDYVGMDSTKRADQKFLGVICSLKERTVFVKMIGPAAQVSAQREKFLQFVKSLRLKS